MSESTLERGAELQGLSTAILLPGAGLFGVPTLTVDGFAFWGLDALEMVAACLRGDPWFEPGGGWDQAGAPRPGLQRLG